MAGPFTHGQSLVRYHSEKRGESGWGVFQQVGHKTPGTASGVTTEWLAGESL